MADEDVTQFSPPPEPGLTPTGYRRTLGGDLRWEPPTVEHLQTLLPQYEIISLVGRGGMGAVYKARQITLDRPVAIKILPPEAAESDPQFIERFRNEGRTMARLDHPAIVQVFDYGETAERQLYFIMQFVDGTDVQQMIHAQGKLPPDYALAITAHVCDALQYAHAHSVIHRDIKPANVLLNMEGQVKVADFGLAKAGEASASMTRTNMSMGTPDYIAPESLIIGMGTVDHRADLYAVGVMLHHMLTGEVPRGMFDLPSRRDPKIDARFDAIITKAMKQRREERYQSALEIRQDLDQILSTPIIQQGQPSSAAVPKQALARKPVARGPQAKEGIADTPVRNPNNKGGKAAGMKEAGRSPRAPVKKSNALIPAVLVGLVALGIGGFFVFKPKAPEASSAPPDNGISAAGSDAKTPGHDDKVAPSKPKKSPPPATSASASSSLDAKTPPPVPKQWIDATAEVRAALRADQAEDVPGGWRARSPVHVPVSDPKIKPRNVVLRVRHRSNVSLRLRNTENQGFYSGDGNSIGNGSIGFFDATARTEEARIDLARGTLPASARAKEPHETIFAAQGDELSLWLEGTLVAKARDSRLTAGYLRLFVLKDSTIEKVEWAELPDDAAAPAKSTPSAPPTVSSPPANAAPAPVKLPDPPVPKQWTDATASARNNVAPDQTEDVSGGWRAKTLMAVINITNTKPRNAVLKVRYRGSATLGLRTTENAGLYSGRVNSLGQAVLEFFDFKVTGAVGLAAVSLPTKPRQDEFHEAILAAQGDQLRLWFDGQLAVEATDTRLTAGRVRLRVDTGTTIQKIEYAELPEDAPKPLAKPPAGPLPPELATLDEQFKELTQERVTVPFDADVAKLNSDYLGGLDRAISDEKKAGHLDSVLALEDEIKLMGDKQTIPSIEDENTSNKKPPEALQKLRAIYRDAHARLEQQRAANLKLLTDPLNVRLQTLESDLTKQDRIAEAKGVKEYREELGKGSAGTPARNQAPVGEAAKNNETDKLRSREANVRAPLSATSAFTNSLGMKFVFVPGTRILLCIHETRRKDYAAYAAENPATGTGSMWMNSAQDGVPVSPEDDYPVTQVCWEDGQAFCAWLGKKEGRIYRLPTDREWSYAVGIGSKENKNLSPESLSEKLPGEHPWGAKWPPPAGAGNYADAAAKEKHLLLSGFIDGYNDGFATTAPVMSFQPNKLGIYDLGGNVGEWCEDWTNAAHTKRVIRGGDWRACKPNETLSSYRGGNSQNNRGNNVYGFRCALEITNGSPVPASPPPPAPKTSPAAATEAAPGSTFTNSLGMKFIPVSGTKVLFCIHETRYKDYTGFAAENPAVDTRQAWKNQNQGYLITERADEHPVTFVSWEDAQKFCEWLGRKEGKAYRLPTDREWSIAAGIGTTEKWRKDLVPAAIPKVANEFPWGTQWPPPKGAGNYSDQSRKTSAPKGDAQYVDGYSDGYPTTSPVMSFKPNRLGLYDMGGNAREWVEDWYDGTLEKRAVRGACWSESSRTILLSSYRSSYLPDLRDGGTGFRCVVEVSAPK